MKNGKLGEEASKILHYIWSLAEDAGGHIKIDNSEGVFMPLAVEIIDHNQISLAHYGEQNDDLMADPEMIFFKNMSGEYEPIYFKNDYLGVERICATVISEYEAHAFTDAQKKEQRDEVVFAEMWLNNIKEQQKLTTPPRN
jgi:hypothetical protein